jgi:hypothetical protein
MDAYMELETLSQNDDVAKRLFDRFGNSLGASAATAAEIVCTWKMGGQETDLPSMWS